MRKFRMISAFAGLVFQVATLHAIQITGYTTAANDRFESGLPSNPVESSSESFIGKEYDWSGTGWASTNLQKGFGFLSPMHYLVATHYLGSTYVNINDQDSDLAQGTQQGVEATGYGFQDGINPDISIGTLTQPLPSSAPIARYAVLDLNSSSTINSPTAYNNLAVLLYGRGATTTSSPRIGATSILSTTVSGTDTYFLTSRTDVQLEVGDSGSPAFHGWTNPNGGQELTLLGLNTGIDTTNGYNIMSFVGNSGAINAMNALMVDNGFALRVAGNVSKTWAGSSSTSIGDRRAWASSSAPSDVYVKFDAATAGSRSVSVDSNANLRGLYFKGTATSGDSFTFSGSSTLTIGRGGITNYDEAVQAFTATIALGDHQYWDVGSGGVSVANLNTSGKLLEIAGTGTATISGQISGLGGIALSGSRLVLSGSSTYSGQTWAHTGTLQVDGNISSSSGVKLDAGASLSGHGNVGTVSGSGSVDPGNSPGILTAASLNASEGLDFNLEFTQTGSPDYGTASDSGNDVLRLTGATPFSQSLTASNAVNIFLNVTSVQANDIFRGGFFTDNDVPFFNSIASASYLFYLASSGGATIYNGVNYAAYGGLLTFNRSTVQETASFSSGTQPGYVLQIQAIPEPAAVVQILLGGVMLFLVLRIRSVPNKS